MRRLTISIIVILLTSYILYGQEMNEAKRKILYEPKNENHHEMGFGVGFGVYTNHNTKLKPVFGDIPMFNINLFVEDDKKITVAQLSYGMKRSVQDKIYIEYAGSTTNGVPNYTHFNNLVSSCFNLDLDMLYKIIDYKRFRFVAGPGMNLTVLMIKGDEMKGLAGGLLYGGELNEEDTGNGFGLELVSGVYVFMKKIILQFHVKYQTAGLWFSEYVQLPTFNRVSDWGIYDISGFQISIGLGLHY